MTFSLNFVNSVKAVGKFRFQPCWSITKIVFRTMRDELFHEYYKPLVAFLLNILFEICAGHCSDIMTSIHVDRLQSPSFPCIPFYILCSYSYHTLFSTTVSLLSPVTVNCLLSLGRWNRRFESYSGHGCLVCVCVYSVFCVVLCLGSGLATGWSLVQGILPNLRGL
jgi:hypothetical protein